MRIKSFSISALVVAGAALFLGFCQSTKDTDDNVTLSLSQAKFSISGKITFDQYNWIREHHQGVMEVYLPGGELRRLLSGAYPWRHPDGDIIFVQGCGDRVNRLVVSDALGRVKVVGPCSSEIPNVGHSPTRFEFSRLSPDKSLIAAEVAYYASDGSDMRLHYSTVVIKEGEIHQVFDNFGAPEWLPDGRLLLVSDGIYLAEVGGTPKKIDDGSLASGPNNLDVDPTGKRIAFEWNQRIWMIGVDGSGLTELAAGSDVYRFPAWSPDGKVVAFLATDGFGLKNFKKGIFFVEVATGKYQFLSLENQLGGHAPIGPLSWVK